MADLSYPLAVSPGTGDGSAIEITPGLSWLRMPLAGPLRWINVWAALESDGVSLIDTGIGSPESMTAWQLALAGPLQGHLVRRVLCTHMHPDHCGLAGWLVEQHRCELWMSRLEYLTCRVLCADTGHAAPESVIAFYRAAGWTEESLAHYRSRFGFFGRLVHALPAAFRRLSDGDELQLGGITWQVIVGNGHSPEHACLYCRERKLLISGDQVLPRISSNVSVFPSEPDADPLSDWLQSIDKLRRALADDVLVLPAHNDPFFGLHARLHQLQSHHEHVLERLLESLATPKRTTELFGLLFARPVGADTLMMATGEALAHLNHLKMRGAIAREPDAAGVWRWSRT